jgi:hypothetical protein
MARFIAEGSFRFESESVETAGADLRRLSAAAQDVGFDLVRGKVTPAPPDEDQDRSGPTYYVPLIDPDE